MKGKEYWKNEAKEWKNVALIKEEVQEVQDKKIAILKKEVKELRDEIAHYTNR